MTAADAYPELVRRVKETALLQSCSAVLGWDQQTYMPAAGADLRGEQLAVLAKLAHAQATDPRLGELLAACDGAFPPDSAEAANVREIRHGYGRSAKLPARLVEELARVTTAAQQAWQTAREADDFPRFRPHLEAVLRLKREEADAVGWVARRYDALLDEYEPGCTAAELTALFANLTAELAPLVAAAARPAEPVEGDFPADRQRLFAESAAAALGFDFTAGRLDTTAHPFCSAFGPGDCRLTTRYHPRRFADAFFGVLHEAGHGLYEQGLPADRFGTPGGSYCSLGVHESQSRLWENQVGRGRPFWRHFLPRLRQAFPAATAGLTADRFDAAINAVRPSLIRVEADEATYNLHVAVRFELELALLDGDLPAADLPGAWAEGVRKYLGLAVPSDRDGCLQDIHWSFGGVGYFPTYTLGNLLAAQLMRAATTAVGADALDREFAAGNFRPLLEWLRTHVHAHGRRYRPGELCRRATGADLSAEPFLAYLRERLSRSCGVC
jgi:carboxypeptidase Taq